MRIVILGAGGIGSIVAAFFARAGHDATLIARGEHLRATRERGIRVTGLAEFTTPVTVAERADGACDALILATKTPDTRSALAAVEGLRPALSLSLQNGVAKDGVLAETFAPVVGATTMVAASRTGPGAVAYTLDGATYVGGEAAELAEAWNATGLHMTVVDNVLGHEWAKQALQGPAATLAVASDLPNHLVHLRLARPFALALREVAAVADAAGIELAAGGITASTSVRWSPRPIGWASTCPTCGCCATSCERARPSGRPCRCPRARSGRGRRLRGTARRRRSARGRRRSRSRRGPCS